MCFCWIFSWIELLHRRWQFDAFDDHIVDHHVVGNQFIDRLDHHLRHRQITGGIQRLGSQPAHFHTQHRFHFGKYQHLGIIPADALVQHPQQLIFRVVAHRHLHPRRQALTGEQVERHLAFLDAHVVDHHLIPRKDDLQTFAIDDIGHRALEEAAKMHAALSRVDGDEDLGDEVDEDEQPQQRHDDQLRHYFTHVT
jgi:hypothetical protein